MSSSDNNNNNNDNHKSMSATKYDKPLIISKEATDYVMKVGYNESTTAKELRAVTSDHPRCRMMGDPIEASFFHLLLSIMNAKRVVEIGVFTGYTTLIMADAVGPDGKIYALDINDEYVNVGRQYWKQDDVSDRIDVRIGPAIESLQLLSKEILGDDNNNEKKSDDDDDDDSSSKMIDFAFIDADKVNYRAYYEAVLELIRPNGIIAIDNVLWSGRVWKYDNENDDDTVALRELSNFIQTDARVEHVLLPFADGVTLVRKK